MNAATIDQNFLNEVGKLRRMKNFTFTDEAGRVWTGEAAIAKHFGMSMTKFRRCLSIAKFAKREAKKMGFTIVPCEDGSNGRYYIKLIDGYHLVYDNDGYQGRYDPNMSEAI